jgi:hypothetical protein
MPWLLGAVTATLIWYVWGSLNEPPIWHDEAAYLFQATIFAQGRWTAPPPPIPEFFEQAYVLVTPTYAAKYPPGNSLLMTLGMWFSAPGLVAVLLAGITGGLVFALARRLAGVWVALLTWLVWLGTPDNLRFHASYLSEGLTGALWLLGWWTLIRWRETGSRGWLVALALAIGWGAITRPLTMLAFAIPASIVIVKEVWQRRAWSQLLPALGVGVLVLAIGPLWSARTTGDWRVTPLDAYTRAYLPWDYPGFGITAPAPTRALPPDMVSFDRSFRQLHAEHTVDRLPEVLVQRGFLIAYNNWREWRVALVPFALLGLVGLSAGAVLALGTAVLHVLAYGTYAHYPSWTVYYLELHPVLAFVTACGLVRAASKLPRRGAAVAFAAVAAALVADTTLAARHWRAFLGSTHRHQEAFQAAVTGMVREPAIVFVRYAQDHDVYRSLIVNEPFLDRAKIWVVYDRGTDNARLTKMFPDRRPYLFDESTARLTGLDASGDPLAEAR